MECQAPQRLNADGSINQEYIDFMKKIPTPKERAKMTDEILNWFISRRGGDREIIKEKIGQTEFKNWIKNCQKYNHFECDFVSGIMVYLNRYVTQNNKQSENWDEEKILQLFEQKQFDRLGYISREGMLTSIYTGFYNTFIDSFRNSDITDWEYLAIKNSGSGIEEKDWELITSSQIKKNNISNKYCIG